MHANRVGVAVLVLVAPVAMGQIVLRDAPRRDPAGEPPRWLGKSGVVVPANRRVLVDPALHCIEASEVQIAGPMVRYRDAHGRLAQLDRSEIVMLLPATPGQEAAVYPSAGGAVKGIEWKELTDAAAGPQGRVEMVDGEVIPGQLVDAVSKPDSIAWEHALLGTLDLPIESVAKVVLRAGSKDAREGTDSTSDVVVFTNGDLARGVVDSIVGRGTSGEVTMSVDRKTITTSLDRVASVTLANPPKAPRGVFVWLRDGTVIAGATAELGTPVLTLSDGTFTTGSGRTIQVPWDDVVGVNMDAARVVPLSSVPLVEVKAGEGREWSVPPRIEPASTSAGGVGEVELSGPIVARWSLPEGVRLITMSVSMPESARALGDCLLVVECGGQTLRQRLNGKRPTADLRLTPTDETAPTLTISIESGEGGSIQDRVVIRRGLMLVK
jgi:hypothetical protein